MRDPKLSFIVCGLLMLASCSTGDAQCADLTRDAAIKMAIAAKSGLRPGDKDKPLFASSAVKNVALNDGRGFGATVEFAGNQREAPIALIYEDCEIGWTTRPHS